ncbi:MAG: AAA family ATPase [Candidatus Latescibacteria bacterium]|nr:AAA family ATPase [Candidatus Latescibacterota bacterium]
MKAIRFRVQNFRNIDDSGWISLEKVTAFVGRNESGKTALLKALHKFNPATPEPYEPQREFPRDRYTRDYVSNGSKGEYWPVCKVEFEIPEGLRTEIEKLLKEEEKSPKKVTATRYYDGTLKFEYASAIETNPLTPKSVLSALDTFASSARRLVSPDIDQAEATAAQRTELVNWTTGWKDKLKDKDDLRGDEGVERLSILRAEVENYSNPQTADMVEALQKAIEPVLDAAKEPSVIDQIDEMIKQNLPVLIYFENYGILGSAIWLPHFIEDLEQDPNNSRVRTINALFQHVGLDPKEIRELGDVHTLEARHRGFHVEPEQIAADLQRIDERAIKLNSASIDISKKFSEWWSQRRHKIHYQADGDYFRIWIADDRREDVQIELEARSKGFQWFFSFYLVFLVESEYGHKDAILLLDEPGLHLHPTAQQKLITFFEKLSETNQLAYTTHSPFLIDGEHLHRVRPVTEDDTGHSCITAETWPKDRETIFPLQAAAGYAMMRGLFQHHKNVLVEGMSDFYYLHALSQQCAKSGRTALPDDIYITPCGGTKHVGHFASMFLGHEVRPLVLLDGDDAGHARQNALMKELYVDHNSGILMLDDVLNRPGEEVEIEDILGECLVLKGLEAVLDNGLKLNQADRSAGSLPSQIKAAAKRQARDLPEGWKASVALHLVSSWAEEGTTLSDEVLDTASLLFSAINEWFENVNATG